MFDESGKFVEFPERESTEWFGRFDDILEGDEEGIAGEGLRRGSREDRKLKGSVLSRAWGKRRYKKEDAQKVVFDLLEIQQVVTNILKIHGIPKNTQIGLALLGHIGKGLATFEDIPGWTKPRLLIDKAVYEEATSEEMLDVYIGIALHEASHLNHTRLGFMRMKSGELKDERKIMEGLLEDERIEELAREESPGFAGYIMVAKRFIFDGGTYGKSLKVWEDAPDLDKIRMLILGIIRCPYLLTEEMKAWRAINEECVYETINKLLSKLPRMEVEVKAYGTKLDEFYRRMKDLYEEEIEKDESGERDDIGEEGEPGGETKSMAEGSGGSTGESDKESSAAGRGVDDEEEAGEDEKEETEDEKKESEKKQRLARDRDALKDDEEYEKAKKELESEEEIRRGAESVEEVAEDIAKPKDDRKIEAGIKDEKEYRKELKKAREGRFGEAELKELIEYVVEDALSSEESVELVAATEDRTTVEGHWINPRHIYEKRRTIVTHPRPTDELRKRHKKCVDVVRGDVNRMKSVFRLRLGERQYVDTELVEGRLHRRMVGRASVTDRIFYRTRIQQDKGIALCLLLDESGSMGVASVRGNGRASIAYRLATLIAMSLQRVPGIELEVYSYASCGLKDEDNLVKYLYGKSNPHLESIAAYEAGHQNYDHEAIRVAGDLFIKNTLNENRLMIVLSDGAPSGNRYGGSEAIRATKKSVDILRSKGVQVLAVAITSYAADRIYGRKWVLEYTDLPNLINRMRILVTRIVKNVTESR